MSGRPLAPSPAGVVVATGNAHKAREICEVLTEVRGGALAAWAVDAPDGVTVAFLVAAPDHLAGAVAALPPLVAAPDVDETGATLVENARIKARALAAALDRPAVADDTGLEVDALGGAPGVRSARYAGAHSSDADNVARLLADLEGVAPPRRARFATVALLAWPDGAEVIARGEVEGMIAPAPRGSGGFGYDPVFVPEEGDGRTFAEMTAGEKHACSHRGRAFRSLAPSLDALP